MIEFLVSAVPLLLAGAVGFMFGVLRDRSKTRAERRAKHQDQVLEASAGILDASASLGKARLDLAEIVWQLVHDRSGANQEYRGLLEEQRQEAFRNINDAETTAHTHRVRLSILAPGLEDAARQMLFASRRDGNDPESWQKSADKHMAATTAFQTAVQEHLGMSTPEPPRQWRPWVRKPLRWSKMAFQKVRRLFLV